MALHYNWTQSEMQSLAKDCYERLRTFIQHNHYPPSKMDSYALVKYDKQVPVATLKVRWNYKTREHVFIEGYPLGKL